MTGIVSVFTKGKFMKVVYLHIDNNDQVFYVGSGTTKRPYNFSGRSEDWFKHKAQFGLSEVQIYGEYPDKASALKVEEELTNEMRELNQPLVNKFSGTRRDAATILKQKLKVTGVPNYKNTVNLTGKFGEANNGFKGYSVGVDDKSFVIFAGRAEMKNNNFDPTSISACIIGRPSCHTYKGFKWKRQATINQDDFIGLEPYNELSAERLIKSKQ